MTVEMSETTGAALRVPKDWHAIDWQMVHKNVRRLQARIVKAEKEGRHGKVKALQRLLTHSFSGKALAVRRVTENQGKKTPGVDHILWRTPEAKTEAIRSLKRRGYQPLPLKRVNIPKSNGKLRPLGIPTMKDRAMQALYLLALDPIAECRADPNSYGFRRERSCADAIKQCSAALSRSNCPRWILEGDIKSCFDRISHDWLLANIPMDKAILHKWLKSGYMEKEAFFETTDGTPQGGIISPVLANMALDGLERALKRRYPHHGPRATKGQNQQVNLIRYADDFILTGKSKEVLEDEVKPMVEVFMRERGLELSPEKTVITHIDEGFDFLGQTIRRYNGKYLTKPSKKNVKTFLANIREVIKANKQATAYALIVLLNPKIRGWANYHRHVASKSAFTRVDSEIFQALWRWAKRRHPKKSRRWIAKKYFGRTGLRNWRFFGEGKNGKGQPIRNWITFAASTPIKRHVKVQQKANPYDPEWEVYFEERLGLKMAAHLHGRRQLSRLWKERKGRRLLCNQPITKVTKWHNHHLIHRVMGGPDVGWNRVLLHPDCHRQLHAKGLSVSKPRSSPGV